MQPSGQFAGATAPGATAAYQPAGNPPPDQLWQNADQPPVNGPGFQGGAIPAGQPEVGQPGFGAPGPIPFGQPNQAPVNPWLNPPIQDPGLNGDFLQPPNTADIDISAEEARTGRFMFGMGVNSNAGVSGQIVVDERNFDITRFPTSFEDILNGTAWRSAGQGFRIEAMPGNQVQRYLVSFTEPYLLSTPVSFNLSGFLFDRRFQDWDEQRIGGRVGLGYRLTPDLSLSTSLRGERVEISDPRVLGVPELDSALGRHELFGGRVTLTHDTRDVPFLPTEGHLIELAYEQVFGSFDYPRGELDYRRFFLIRERPDGSGRHTLATSLRLGVSGSQTPIFENFFAGGFSTIRGFDFRGASPMKNSVRVGGEFTYLSSIEYMFPLTADDMIRGVAFVDGGTVEEKIRYNSDNFRVAPGIGLRISIPALGPAPLALDFAVPIARAPGDDIQNFSFFFGFGRN